MKMIKWDEIWVEDEAGQTSSCSRGLREWEPKHKALEQEGELRQDRGWCGERKEWVPDAEKWACCFDRHLSPPHHPRLPGDQCKKHTGPDYGSRWETRQDPGSWRQNLHELEEEGPLGADLLCVWVFRTLTIRYRCRHTNFLFLFGYWWKRGWVVTRSENSLQSFSVFSWQACGGKPQCLWVISRDSGMSLSDLNLIQTHSRQSPENDITALLFPGIKSYCKLVTFVSSLHNTDIITLRALPGCLHIFTSFFFFFFQFCLDVTEIKPYISLRYTV